MTNYFFFINILNGERLCLTLQEAESSLRAPAGRPGRRINCHV